MNPREKIDPPLAPDHPTADAEKDLNKENLLEDDEGYIANED